MSPETAEKMMKTHGHTNIGYPPNPGFPGDPNMPVKPDMPKGTLSPPQMTPERRRELMQGAKNTYQQARAAATDAAARQKAREAFNAARKDIRTQFRNPPIVNKPYAPDVKNPLRPGPGMKSGGKVSSASKRADGCAIRGKTRA